MALKDRLTSIATTVGGRANNAIENGKLNLGPIYLREGDESLRIR